MKSWDQKTENDANRTVEPNECGREGQRAGASFFSSWMVVRIKGRRGKEEVKGGRRKGRRGRGKGRDNIGGSRLRGRKGGTCSTGPTSRLQSSQYRVIRTLRLLINYSAMPIYFHFLFSSTCTSLTCTVCQPLLESGKPCTWKRKKGGGSLSLSLSLTEEDREQERETERAAEINKPRGLAKLHSPSERGKDQSRK